MSKAAELAALIGSQTALSNRNLIINGAMQVAQRGTSSTTNGYASLDRWTNSHGGGTVTQTQESLTGGDPYDDGHRNFLRATNTSAGSTAATDSLQIYQVIESQDLASSGWKSTSSSSFITLSAWVRSSLAGTYYVRLYIYDGNKNYASAIALSADTWEKITITIQGASGNTVNNDNGAGMFVNIAPYLGTDNTDSGFTLNQWATFSSTSQAPDYAQNWRSTGSATFDITGVQLEVGEQATPFEHRSFGDELARCQRYYQIIPSAGSYAFPLVRHQSGTNLNSGSVYYPVTMRANATLTLDSSGSWIHKPNIRNDSGSASLVSSSPSLFTLLATPSTNDTANYLAYSNNNVEADAELQMIIINAQYYNDLAGNQVGIKATIDGTEMFVPLDPANRHYAEILRQVAAGELTIADAD